MPLPLVPIGLGIAGAGLLSNLAKGDPYDDVNRRMERYMQMVQGRQAPQAGPAAQSALSGFRDNQSNLISRLEAMSRGEGPSLATETLKQATDRNMAQQSSVAAGGRGNAALAQFTAANNMGRLGQQASGDAATARIAEQQMALQQLGSNINAGRQSDEGNSQFNATATNFRDRDNLEAKLRTMGYNDQAIQQMLQNMTSAAGRPTMGDQLMAGGAGLLSFGATQQAQANAPRR